MRGLLQFFKSKPLVMLTTSPPCQSWSTPVTSLEGLFGRAGLIAPPAAPARPVIVPILASYKVSPTGETLYRYEGHAEHHEGGETTYWLCINSYPVMRHTPKCYVIDVYGNEKTVLKTARVRFAYPDQVLAAESFAARCDWRKRYLTSQLRDAEAIDALRAEVLN